MNNTFTEIRVRALSICAVHSTGETINIITSGKLSAEVNRLFDFGADYAYDPDTNTLHLEWEDEELMTTISWTFTLNKDTGRFEGK